MVRHMGVRILHAVSGEASKPFVQQARTCHFLSRSIAERCAATLITRRSTMNSDAIGMPSRHDLDVAITLAQMTRLAFAKYQHNVGIEQTALPAPLSSGSILMFHGAVEAQDAAWSPHNPATRPVDA